MSSFNNGFQIITGSFHPEQVYCIPTTTAFPKLRDLVALEQYIIDVVLWGGNTLDNHDSRPDMMPNNRACQLRYPVLRRLYVLGDEECYVSPALPTLQDLRLNMLRVSSTHLSFLRGKVGHLHSLIIDSTVGRFSVCLRDFMGGIGKSERNGIGFPANSLAYTLNQRLVLSAWSDAVVGGEGFWTTAWAPTSTTSDEEWAEHQD